MEETFVKLALNYGFPAAIVIVQLLLFKGLLSWLGTQYTAQQNQQLARENALLALIGDHRKALEEHTVQAREFHSQVNAAHEFQRREHAEHSDDHKETASILTQLVVAAKGTAEAVGRINGYKEH